jgi:hemolysin III
MTDIALSKERFSDKEDLANALSHTAGLILSFVALILMVVNSASRGTALHIIASFVFGFSMIFLYGSSSIAHWLSKGKWKDAFFTLDQIAIFVLIAGTYTPLSLIALKGPVGWVVFGVEWGLALFGIIRLISRNNKFEAGVAVLDILIYIGMGWLVLLVSSPILKTLPVAGFVWIIIGGLFYTLGVIFFKIAKFRFHHLVWHLMVIGGTASHFIAIFYYILP